ncbi:hypothetical protein PybrP1_008176, partial [[Pythium] brassicae (nom. inval.)]
MTLAGHQFQPGAVVPDRELGLVNTILEVFLAARHILRAWHIAKNIHAKCKNMFPIDGDE